MKMILRAAIGLALVAPLPLRAEVIFSCSFGARQASVTLEGDLLTYRYGRPGRPEIAITGGPASGNPSYHRRMFARGEHQTLRFRAAGYSYLVHSLWVAPTGGGAEHLEAGVVVMRGDTVLRELGCRSGGDMREYPVFQRLPQEPTSPLPERD